eukprot:g10905.t1
MRSQQQHELGGFFFDYQDDQVCLLGGIQRGWQERGSMMGCCRSVEYDRARNRSASSTVMTCISYSTGQESKGLSRKSYRGRWIPGDPLTGSGGGCASPTFLQNPFYPVTIQRNSTTVTVCLSVRDRAWQADPSRGGPAIGYYVLRLTGSKPRLTKLLPSKIAGRSVVFVSGPQSTGEHTFDAGRYAFVPVTVKPLASAETFLLDLTASNTAVEWEQTDDRIRDLDQELKLSDDEGDAANATSVPASAADGKPGVVNALPEETVESEDVDGPPGNKVAEALHEQIADLSNLVAELESESLQRRNSLSMEELEGSPGLGLGFDGLSLSSIDLKRGLS